MTREAGGEVVSAADQSGVSITLTPAYTPTFDVDASLTLSATLAQEDTEDAADEVPPSSSQIHWPRTLPRRKRSSRRSSPTTGARRTRR